MAEVESPDVLVYVCANCIPQAGRLPRQWVQSGARIVVQEVPCSGKMDGRYLFHGFEAGVRGVCVVACPKGECHLAQGNYRAEIRLRMVQKLLIEMGLERQRSELLHCSPEESFDQLEQMVHDAVNRLCALPENPLRTLSPEPSRESVA